MWLLRPKPPLEISCPVCGAKVIVHWNKNSQYQPKPYCASCGWNVARARRHFVAQVGQIVIMAALFAAYAWAITGMRWVMLFLGGWMFIVMGAPIITQFRRLPPSRPAPPLQPLAGIADLVPVTLETVTPRLNIVLEALIVVASAIAILLLPREFDPAKRRLPPVRDESLLVILTMLFVAYQLGVHGVMFFRLVRSVWLERHLAKRAMSGKGRVTRRSDSGTIRYEFLDYTSRLQHGAGRDYTLGLYEDMPLTVLYDPDDPTTNMPIVGLQFHRRTRGDVVGE
jgi:predicted RNA-binding Zn-ribbon protein involved in translation (DUF1610 family)